MSNLEVVIKRQIAFDAPRNEVVSYVQDVANVIRDIPLSLLAEVRDLSDPEARYPTTLGERVANSVSYVLATQDWLEDDSEDVLSETFDVMTRLDISVANIEDWKRFIELADQLT